MCPLDHGYRPHNPFSHGRYEYYQRNDNMSQSSPNGTSKYQEAWKANDNYIVPWGCSVIP